MAHFEKRAGSAAGLDLGTSDASPDVLINAPTRWSQEYNNIEPLAVSNKDWPVEAKKRWKQ